MEAKDRRNLMSPSAYDTAWLAKIPGSDFDLARDWVINNQNEDGSWG